MASLLRKEALKEGHDSPLQLVSKSSKWRTWLSENLNPVQSHELIDSWAFQARHNQVIPEGRHWRVWCCFTGKGFGKNRIQAEFVHYKAGLYPQYAGFLAARTSADVIKTIVNDTESGLLATQHKGNPCEFKTHPTQRVVWENGAHADVHTSEEPDRSRGTNYLWGICDEVATWKRTIDFAGNDCFTNLNFSLRAGKRDSLVAQMVVGSTPRPNKLVKKLLAAAQKGGTYRLTTGTMYDNAANLSDGYIAEIEDKHKGTRLFRQEALGELLTDLEDAILTLEMLEKSRVEPEDVPDMARVVVAVDPALSHNKKSDKTGIEAVGNGVDGDLYALADRSCKMSPDGWSRRVVDTCHEFDTLTVVAETNVIGEGIETLIRYHDRNIRVIPVQARSAKHQRAEPILAFHERGEAHIVGSQPDLEDQLVQFTPTGWDGDGSPDNADAYIHGARELMLNRETSWDDYLVALDG
jgi:phage terminase large subunit-like protein